MGREQKNENRSFYATKKKTLPMFYCFLGKLRHTEWNYDVGDTKQTRGL
jgi:hypothetical protein